MNPTQQQRSRIKLAGTYLAIIMTMSILFSVVLYNVSSNQLDRSLRQVQGPGQGAPRDTISEIFDVIRRARLEESRAELQKKLFIFNISTLLLGSVLSYLLAREALRPIEETMEAQNRFTSDASHELRTPLTAMRSEIEVALRSKKLNTADAKSVLSSNLEEITKLEALTAGLLQLAKQENTEAQFVDISLARIVADAVSQTETLASNKHISITEKTENDVKSKSEPTSLTQVAVILLDNAIKYSPEKSEVIIEVNNGKGGGGFSVKDTGGGISKSDLPHVFDRFYRTDSSRTRNAKEQNGYGLGLAIAKQIVEAHNGSIEISSQVGKGTTVKVSLPN